VILKQMRPVKGLALGGVILVSLAGGAAIAHSASGGSSQPSVVIGEATGQVFGGNVSLKPDSSQPALDAEQAVGKVWGGPSGGVDEPVEAIYGLAVPLPGLGMLASPRPVWAILESNVCIPVFGPPVASHGKDGCDSAKVVIFVDANTGEVLGMETMGA
jgi:hypothetical protein